MKRNAVTSLLLMMALVGMECPAMTDTGMPGTPGSMTPATPGSGDRFTLTVTLRSLNGCRGLDPEAPFFCRGMEAHIFIGDEVVTRQTAQFNNGNFDSTRGGNEDPEVATFQVEPGKSVTIFAFESMGTRGLFTNNDSRDDFEMGGTDRVEFVRFDGDPVASPEEGVATFTMNSDMSVDLVYQRMPTLTVRIGGTAPFLPGFWENITIDAPTWLTLPDAMGVNPLEGSTDNANFNVVEGFVYIAEMKTGTTITFTPGSLTGFEFDTWDMTENQCGPGSCELTLGVDTDPIALWKAVP